MPQSNSTEENAANHEHNVNVASTNSAAVQPPPPPIDDASGNNTSNKSTGVVAGVGGLGISFLKGILPSSLVPKYFESEWSFGQVLTYFWANQYNLYIIMDEFT